MERHQDLPKVSSPPSGHISRSGLGRGRAVLCNLARYTCSWDPSRHAHAGVLAIPQSEQSQATTENPGPPWRAGGKAMRPRKDPKHGHPVCVEPCPRDHPGGLGGKAMGPRKDPKHGHPLCTKPRPRDHPGVGRHSLHTWSPRETGVCPQRCDLWWKLQETWECPTVSWDDGWTHDGSQSPGFPIDPKAPSWAS